ncbi:acylphosphatase [Rhodovulum iodosum]|uniref:Acylphosphatase n=1 Tax=Rhodovulum iodosum TaxID=68291 RepID=A0ABV3XXY5_9RHOB|nr:acylphosphatase [Rhodovulum robiginosum]RSK37844.1 acylphosphatase [Rhodovulum robiginosum]
MSERIAVRVKVTGRVQGVGFRAWTEREAQALGLDGWVRNETDGAVTALIAGPRDRVQRLVDALNSGPPGARVEHVVSEPAPDDAGPGFRVAF